MCGRAERSRRRTSAGAHYGVVSGIMVLCGSAMSMGLTFLHSMQGDPWAPMRTGSFFSSYIGVDIGIEQLFDLLGWSIVYDTIIQEPIYYLLAVLGVIAIVVA